MVQVKGWQRSFQPSMKRRIAVGCSATEVDVPRRMAWREMMPKNTSTRLSHDLDVGVKCRWMRGCFASQARTAGWEWVA